MIPDYMRPDLPVLNIWPTGSAYGADEAAIQDAKLVGWQEFFRSPNLQAIIQTALDNNRDLRIAALNVEAARSIYQIQRADLLPTVSTGVGSIRQRSVSNIAGFGESEVTYTQYSASVGVTAYELDLFGRVRSLNRSALEQYFATEEATRAARIALIAEVANAYLALLADRKLLALTEETLATQNESFELISRSFEYGIGSALDVAQAKTAVESARANLSQYQRLVAQDKNALTLLIGTEPDPQLLEGEALDDVALIDDLPVGLPSQVLLQRPDVLQAEHELKSANANIGAARANFFPTISLTGAYGRSSSELSNLFSGGGETWNFAPQITLPIFTGGFNLATLRNARVNQEISVATYERTVQTAFREVADELAARGTYTEQLNAQNALVEAAQRSYDLSDARYRQGIDSHLVRLDAQRELYSAQSGAILIQQQRLSNLVTLYKALGGGL